MLPGASTPVKAALACNASGCLITLDAGVKNRIGRFPAFHPYRRALCLAALLLRGLLP
jgi:hypothetical protein